jgi:hypothetical protein
MTAHASKKTNHLQSAAQPSLPFQGTSWGFQAEPTEERVIINGFLKKRLRQTKQIRKFSTERNANLPSIYSMLVVHMEMLSIWKDLNKKIIIN